MIVPGTRFKVARVPLNRIVVTEHQTRYPDRVLHYVGRLQAEPDNDLALIHLAPYTPDDSAPNGGTKHRAVGLWQILDGHHRYVAHILTGRPTVLALLTSEPGWPGHEELKAEDGWTEV